MQTEFSVVLKERDDLQTQLTKAQESSKRLLEETIKNDEQNLQIQVRKYEECLAEVENREQIIRYFQDETKKMQARLNHLDEERSKVARDCDQLRENRDQLKEERDDLLKQVQKVCDEKENIKSELNAKVKEAEIFASERNHLENEYCNLQQQLRETSSERDKAQTELVEVKQQLETVCVDLDEVKQELKREWEDKAALVNESRSKTQQVKQYKKQVDGFRTQLQDSNARIDDYHMRLEQCKKELLYCQIDLKKREEYEENSVRSNCCFPSSSIVMSYLLFCRLNLLKPCMYQS